MALKQLLSRMGYNRLQGNPGRQSYISSGPTNEFSPDTYSQYGRERVPPEDLEWYYSHDPLTWNGINMKSSSIWGKGMYIVADDPEARRLSERLLKLPNFRFYIVKGITGGFVYGSQPIELIWDKYEDNPNGKGQIVSDEAKNIVGMAETDPKLFEPELDEFGNLKRWYQKLPTVSQVSPHNPHDNETAISSSISGTMSSNIQFHPDQIAHFKFWSRSDNFLGIGLVEPLVSTIHTVMGTRISMGDLIYRYGVPFTHAILEDGEPEEVRRLSAFLKKISSKSSFVSNQRYRFDFPGVGRRVPDLSFALDFLTDTLAGGLRMPKPILLQAGEKSNRAVLEQLARWNMEDIIDLQESVSNIIEMQILKPLMVRNGISEVPKVKWFPMTEEREEIVLQNQKQYLAMLKDAVASGFMDKGQAISLFEKKLNLQDGEAAPALRRLTNWEKAVTGPWNPE